MSIKLGGGLANQMRALRYRVTPPVDPLVEAIADSGVHPDIAIKRADDIRAAMKARGYAWTTIGDRSMSDLAQRLADLSAKATGGEWEVDSERDDDACYGGGPDHGAGFHNYFIGADVDGKWKTLLDTVNSEHKIVEEEYDEDHGYAWDMVGKANVEFIVSLVNAYRAGELVPATTLAAKDAEIATITAERDVLAKRVGELDDPAFAGLRKKINEVVEDSGRGFWRPCTGCYESEDGYPIGHYPRSDVLQCVIGAGCSECGGIGAIWDDLDYDAFARATGADHD